MMFGTCAGGIFDIVRGAIVVPDFSTLLQILEFIHESSLFDITRVKNRFEHKTPAGYGCISLIAQRFCSWKPKPALLRVVCNYTRQVARRISERYAGWVISRRRGR